MGLRLVAEVVGSPLADPSKPRDEGESRPEHRRPYSDQYRDGPRIELSIFDCVQPPKIKALITRITRVGEICREFLTCEQPQEIIFPDDFS